MHKKNYDNVLTRLQYINIKTILFLLYLMFMTQMML